MAAFYVAGACRLGSRQRSRIAATATVAKRKLRQWVAWNTTVAWLNGGFGCNCLWKHYINKKNRKQNAGEPL